jgi:hypothetical protein
VTQVDGDQEPEAHGVEQDGAQNNEGNVRRELPFERQSTPPTFHKLDHPSFFEKYFFLRKSTKDSLLSL